MATSGGSEKVIGIGTETRASYLDAPETETREGDEQHLLLASELYEGLAIRMSVRRRDCIIFQAKPRHG